MIFYKGVKEITNSDRVLKEHQDDMYRFSLKNAGPTDSGTYWLVARNEHGTDRAFVTITVNYIHPILYSSLLPFYFQITFCICIKNNRSSTKPFQP